MPRYSYRCNACQQVSTVHHLSSETLSDCSDCDEIGTMVKLLNRFSTAPKKNLRKKVGQVTEEFIADAREDLKQQKQIQKEKL